MLAIAPALTLAAACLAQPGERPASPGSAAIEFVVDASVNMGVEADSRLPMVLDTLREAVTRAERPGLRAAVRLYGSEKDASSADCGDTLLAIPFAPPDAEAWARLLAPVRSRGSAALATALEAASRDLAAEKAAAKLLVLIAGGTDGCGGDACKTVADLTKAGLASPRVIVVSANLSLADSMACAGSIVRAAGPAPLAEALADAIADAGATTGLSVTYHEGSGRVTSRRFAAVPVGHARRNLVSGSRPGETYSLPQGTYQIELEDATGPAPIARVTHGEVTRVALGQGSLRVRALSFYGSPLAGKVTVSPSGSAPTQHAKTHRTSVPHSTLPVVSPDRATATQPTTQSATQPATQPAGSPPATQPATPAEGAAAAAASAAREGKTGAPIDLPAGRYDVVIHVGGATLRSPDVVIEAGRENELSVRFGALKLRGSDRPVAIADREGRVVGQAPALGTLPLAPGTYRAQSGDGAPLSDWLEVVAGDVAEVELR